MTEPTADRRAAEASTRKIDGKPVLASWMGGPVVAAGEEILNRAGIPTFPYPDTAARAFYYMWRYTYNLRGLYETPALDDGDDGEPRATARRGKHHRRAPAPRPRRCSPSTNRSDLLAAYGIPTVPTEIATDATRPSSMRRADRLSGRAEALLARRSRTRPTSAA